MKKYLSCEGVILDTETGLFDKYYEQKRLNPHLQKKQFLQALDWENWLAQAQVLNNALEIIQNYDPSDIAILTQIYSLQEAQEKIKYFRNKNLKNNIILIPPGITKSNIIDANGNILVDNNLTQLAAWQNNQGISIYYGLCLQEYPHITNLEEILDSKKLEKTLYHK